MEAIIKRLKDLHKQNPHPTKSEQEKYNRELALQIESEYAGRRFSVHDTIPSELIWAKQQLGR
jgi:hypothetical protein